MSQYSALDPKVPAPSHMPAPPALKSERMHLIREDSPANVSRDYLTIFFKHKMTVLVSFLISGILSVSGVLVYASLYLYIHNSMAEIGLVGQNRLGNQFDGICHSRKGAIPQ